jgi:hypothetical protein
MPRCQGFKPNSSPCERIVGASQSYCYSHDPSRAEERRRAASKAARSKPNRELQHVKDRLSMLADGVLEGTVDKGKAAVVSQILNTYIRAVSVDLKATEQLEIVARLEALEHDLDTKARSRPWG